MQNRFNFFQSKEKIHFPCKYIFLPNLTSKLHLIRRVFIMDYLNPILPE